MMRRNRNLKHWRQMMRESARNTATNDFTVLQYESLSAFVAHCETIPQMWHNAGHVTRYSFAQCLELAVKGKESLVPEAERMLSQIEDACGEVPTRQWAPSPYGAYPVVPEFLAGVPVCMRKLEHLEDESSPIQVWVDLTSSGGIANAKLQRRGIALLALVMRLQSIRPIELNLCVGATTNKCGMAIRINTHPLDLASACFVLCHPEFARLPMYASVRNHSRDYLGMLITDVDDFRRLFNASPQDLVITSAFLDDEDVIDKDPVAWVNAQIERYSTGEETQEESGPEAFDPTVDLEAF